jgi:hypothetical protein
VRSTATPGTAWDTSIKRTLCIVVNQLYVDVK